MPNENPQGTDSDGFDVPDDLRRQWDFSCDGVLRSIESTLERAGLARIDIVMLAGRFTLLDQSALDDVLSAADELGKSVVAVGVFNSGLLARDRPAADAKYDYRAAPAELVARANAIADLCEAHDTTLPATAIAFPFTQRAIHRSGLVGRAGPAGVAAVEVRADRFDVSGEVAVLGGGGVVGADQVDLRVPGQSRRDASATATPFSASNLRFHQPPTAVTSGQGFPGDGGESECFAYEWFDRSYAPGVPTSLDEPVGGFGAAAPGHIFRLASCGEVPPARTPAAPRRVQ